MSASSRALVIGGLGFIGVNLTERLVAEGRSVTVVTSSRARHADRAAAFEARGVRIIEGDLRDGGAMATAVAGQQVVFNLAGESGAVRSMEDPWTDLDVNCRGSLVLLEALRAGNREAKLVFVGSRLQYGRQAIQPVGEEQAPDPLCVHAIHKLTVEKYLRLYGSLFGLVTDPADPRLGGLAPDLVRRFCAELLRVYRSLTDSDGWFGQVRSVRPYTCIRVVPEPSVN